MEDTPTKAYSIDPSPKKKRKISKSGLLEKLTAADGFYQIGQIYQLALKSSSKGKKVTDEEGSPDGSFKPIEKGSLRSFKLGCVVTDNRNGREPSRDIERSFRFINVADATGAITLGMKESDASTFGLAELDLDPKDRSEEAYCFFNAEISGSITWIQSSKEKIGVPTFYLNNGSVKRIKELKWNENTNMIFPKTVVCRLMATNKYAFLNRFATTGICGRIDEIEVKTKNSVVMSLEDPVGYIAVEIDVSDTKMENPAKKYIEENLLKRGIAIFLYGKLPIAIMNGEENAIISSSNEDINIEIIKSENFIEYMKKLCQTDVDIYMGIIPEPMSETVSNDEK